MPLENRLKEHRARLGINQADMGKRAECPADDQSDRAGGLFTVGNAGAEAGKDLSGNRGRYFQLYGGRE